MNEFQAFAMVMFWGLVCLGIAKWDKWWSSENDKDRFWKIFLCWFFGFPISILLMFILAAAGVLSWGLLGSIPSIFR
jgi:hypothetical protein